METHSRALGDMMRIFFQMKKKLFYQLALFMLILFGFGMAHSSTQMTLMARMTPSTIDRVSLIKEQLKVLNQRILQSQAVLSSLQNQESDATEAARMVLDKNRLDQLKLNLESTKIKFQAISMELQDAKQSVLWLEKSVEEVQHQISILTTLGIKNELNDVNLKNLLNDENVQYELLHLEKNRLTQLQILQNIVKNLYQIYQDKHQKVIYFQKTQEISMAEQKQVLEEWGYQVEQSQWISRLSDLQKQITQLRAINNESKQKKIWDLEDRVFYAEQQGQFYYAKALLARYTHQLEEINRLSNKSDNVSFLTEMRSQVIMLTEQTNYLKRLIQEHLKLIDHQIQWGFQNQLSEGSFKAGRISAESLEEVKKNYQLFQPEVESFKLNLLSQQQHLEQLLKVELSSRREFSNFGIKTLLDVGKELILAPKLIYQFAKTNFHIIKQDFQKLSFLKWILIIFSEALLIGIFIRAYRWLGVIRSDLYGSVSNVDARNLFLILLSHESVDLFIWLQVLFWVGVSSLPVSTYFFIQGIGLLWLFSKAILKVFRLYTVESILIQEENLLFRYRVFKFAVGLGALLVFSMLFMLQIPLIDELKLLTARVLLFYFLLTSLCWLYYNRMLSEMVIFHIQTTNRYIHRSIKLIGLLLPFLLFVNSILGLLGYFNLITNITKYEGLFILILFAYLVLRGLLTDAMEYLAQWAIQNIKNGWLISESILKPLNKILRILLLLFSGAVLFLLYGWDKQSPVVIHLNWIIHYPFFNVLNSDINLMTLFELFIWLAFFYWAARWVREFMYRFLSTRTKDVGVRNSLAILSQYAVVILGVFIVLRILGIDYRALAFIVSAFALGAGLGLRDLVNNFACGFLILLERPLRVGDIVQVGEEQGEVVHFGSRAVTIRTDNYLEMIVPNSEIFSKTFINWTASNNTVRIVIPFFCDAQNDPIQIKLLIEAILKEQELILPFPEPEVYFKRIVDNKIEFELRYYVDIRKVGTRAKATSAVLTSIFEAFKEKGYKLPNNEHHIFLKNEGK